MGDGVNIAARLQGVAKPGGICISDDAYRQVKSRLDLAVSDLGPTQRGASSRILALCGSDRQPSELARRATNSTCNCPSALQPSH
jgi:class 3 adenylate cyclase